jgi:hypothetical protein
MVKKEVKKMPDQNDMTKPQGTESAAQSAGTPSFGEAKQTGADKKPATKHKGNPVTVIIIILIIAIGAVVAIVFLQGGPKTPGPEPTPTATSTVPLDKPTPVPPKGRPTPKPWENPMININDMINDCMSENPSNRAALCYAVMDDDVEYCNKLEDEDNKADCIYDYYLLSAMQNPDYCDDVPTEDGKTLCNVINEEDLSKCDPASVSESGMKAIMDTGCRAFINRDLSDCDNNQECINYVSTLIALKENDLSWCKDVTNTEDNPARDLCQAVLSDQRELCNKYEKEECYGLVYSSPSIFRGMRDENDCIEVPLEDQKTRCKAVATKDRSMCDQIEDQEVKKLCQDDVDQALSDAEMTE